MTEKRMDRYGNNDVELPFQRSGKDLVIPKPEILIVDDHTENRIALRRILKEVDAGIVEASGGNQALTATLDHEFALAILDVQMPGMDGYELAGLLRSDLRTSRIPVIFLTAAYGEEQHIFKGYEAGGVDYIVKPYNPKILLSKVTVFLELHCKSAELGRKVEALAASEKKYRELMETANSIILRRDNRGIIRFVNEYGCRFFGYRAEELLEKNVTMIMKERETPQADCDIVVKEHSKAGDFPAQVQSESVTKEGETVWVAWSNKVITDTRGDVLEILSIGNDITALKHLEDNLMRHTQDLAVANKELESFSYSVSHDLRAPLRTIKGFSDILLKEHADALDDQGRNFLARIMAGAERMGTLIDDLLNLSRISRLEMLSGTVDLSVVADEVVHELRQTEPQREIGIVVEKGLAVRGDRRLLKVALTNLIGNAWKYTGKTRDPVIEFGSMQKEGRSAYYVRDNGAGFEMKYAAKLFAPFQRLHSEGEFQGTGIGLAIVYRIILRHGGRIWAEGETGKGATFYFSLPQQKYRDGDEKSSLEQITIFEKR